MSNITDGAVYKGIDATTDGFTIKGGRYVLTSSAADGKVQIQAPDGSWVDATDVNGNVAALAAAGTLVYDLPNGQARINTATSGSYSLLSVLS